MGNARRLVLSCVLIMLAALVMMSGYSWLYAQTPLFFAQEASQEVPVWDVVIAGLGMLLGILFGCLYKRVEYRKRKVSFKKEFVAALQSPDFLRAIIVSPIIFCGVYAVARTQPDRLVGLLFAFENGFFCESLFRKRKEPQDAVSQKSR